MSDNFIRNIEIKNFKLFKDFKADGFGRVNLIGGKNNVGKTAFMEAVCINAESKNINAFFNSLVGIKFTRENLEFVCHACTKDSGIELFESIKFYSSKSNINNINYELYVKDGKKEYKFSINGKDTTVNANEFSYQAEETLSNMQYIDNFGFSNKELKDVYIKVQKAEKEDILNNYINEFDNSIEKFKIFDSSPECKLKNNPEYKKINEFGDGLKHYISIICSLYACENGYLFIDEMDNGIHYTQLDKLWEIILTLSKEQNVQVFATTHSKECIESFNRVQKDLNDQNTSYFEMAKNIKTDKIFMTQIDREQLEYGLSHNERIRGE